MIMVFNTVAESFKHMHGPVAHGRVGLFEVDGVLGVSSFTNATETIDIWMMQDYEAWAHKWHVKFPIAQTVHFQNLDGYWTMVASSCDGDVMLLAKFGNYSLLHVDKDGKLVVDLVTACIREHDLFNVGFALRF
jgi:hypothetical protein